MMNYADIIGRYYYTGGECYWIRFRNGRHEVMKEMPLDIFPDHETVFTGHYEDCVEFIEDLYVENEYDLNI